MAILGTDVSENQSRDLPWAAWPFRFVIGRATIGYRRDALYPWHLQQAAANGVLCRGAYHALLHHDREIAYFEPVRQCRAFLDSLIPGLTQICALDIEAAGMTEPLVRAWCDYYDAHCPLPLLLYSNTALNAILAPNPARYLKYFKWVSDYGPYAPGTDRPPLRSDPWTMPGRPLMPNVAGPMKIWQYAGDNGRRPPYNRPIDLNVFQGTEAEMNALFGLAPEPAPISHPAIIRARGKVGPHLNLQGDSDATDWLVRGEPAAAVGVNIGPPGELTRPVFFVARNYENAWNPTDPARDGYSGDGVADARRYAGLWYAPWLPLNPWAHLVATPNEPVVLTLPEMTYAAAFLAELIRIISVDYGRTAVVGNWSVGSPDYPMWAAYRPVLAAIYQYAAFQGRHSYGPIHKDYALRHRSDQAIFTEMGFPNIPVLLTEVGWENIPEVDRAWASEPRRTAQAYADYLLALNAELMLDPYVYGAAVFTYGSNWGQHNINGSGVGRLMADAYQARPYVELAWPTPRPVPPEDDMDTTKIRFDLALIRQEQERISGSLAAIEEARLRILAETETAPALWYEVLPAGIIPEPWPRVRPASSAGCPMRNASGVPLGITRTNNFDLMEKRVLGDGRVIFRVINAPINGQLWYVLATDVFPLL